MEERFMDKEYTCYCGLYCKNCAVKVKVEPASKVLYEEMIKAGFEEIMHLIPGGDKFWPFLKSMASDGVCISCRKGSGNPGCTIRICAIEKGVEMCAMCESYPCDKFTAFSKIYSVLEHDNTFLRKEGFAAWSELQDERHARCFTYSNEK